MGDDLPYPGRPDDPALAALWDDALCDMTWNPEALLTLLRAGGEISGSVAEQLAFSLKAGDLVLAVRRRGRGPSLEARRKSRDRRFTIGAFAMTRIVRAPRGSRKQIFKATADRFNVTTDFAEACFKQFRLGVLEFSGGWLNETWGYRMRALEEWCGENGQNFEVERNLIFGFSGENLGD